MDIVDRFYEILANHKCPAYRAREILGYKSPNSLTRIVQRNVSQDLMLDFAQRLQQHADDLEMTAEEQQSVREGMEELTMGLGHMTAYRQFLKLLSEEPKMPEGTRLRSMSFVNRPQVRTFDPEGVTAMHCTMLGCCPESWLAAIAALEGKAKLHVEYYYEETDGPLPAVQMLQLILPYVDKEWFHPHRIHRDKQAQRLAGSMAVVDIEWGERSESVMLIPQQDKPAIRLPLAPGHPDAKALFLDPGADVANIRWFEGEKQKTIDYMRAIQRKERNHRVVQIKPEIGIQMIPADIQEAAMLEGPGKDNPQLLKALPQMRKIESSRYDNVMSKKFHQHHVMTLDGMRRFAQTGILSDHPWLMRPFTPEEVLTILQKLLNKKRESRYIHLYFLKNQDMKLGDVVWYEGEGVFILLPHMDYHTEKNKTEMRIRDRGFESFFSGFLVKHLIDDAAYSEDESDALLAELVETCRARCSCQQ